MKTASVFMDVEDPINPLADDAALDLANLFHEETVRGSFCITGEKCRTLMQRGRQDVIEAFKPHALGLHTNTHSFHPTTMELLADLSFEEGRHAAFEAEKKGYDSFLQAFGRPPTFWGGAGNTWSPEITDALKRLGVPAYVYALTALPNDAVHKFNGVVGLAQALSISELDWANDQRASARSEEVRRRVQEIPQPWLGIFVGHPTKFRYTEYWDVPYFAGRTPETPEWTAPLPDAVYENSKANLRKFLRLLREDIEIIGVDEALAIPWQFRVPNTEELTYFADHTARSVRSAIGWPVHREGLSPERIVEKTLALSGTVEVGEA